MRGDPSANPGKERGEERRGGGRGLCVSRRSCHSRGDPLKRTPCTLPRTGVARATRTGGRAPYNSMVSLLTLSSSICRQTSRNSLRRRAASTSACLPAEARDS